ncbi:MAG: phosphate-starvation-inducible PsiE family protein [Bacteroidales bacterium]
MSSTQQPPRPLRTIVSKVERYIIQTLIALMSLLLILATIELGYTVYKAIVENGSETLLVDLDNIMNVFGVFLLVLIGIELLDTIKVYFKEHVIHVEVVLLVAIIAVARKVIVLDFEEYTGLEVIGIAAITLALAIGYFLIKKTGGCGFWPLESEEVKDVTIEEKLAGEEEGLIERKKTIRTHTQETPLERDQTGKHPDNQNKLSPSGSKADTQSGKKKTGPDDA